MHKQPTADNSFAPLCSIAAQFGLVRTELGQIDRTKFNDYLLMAFPLAEPQLLEGPRSIA